VWLLATGHVGSPNAIFEGRAGPWPVRVVVRAPGVVPGLADITVRILAASESVTTVTVLPLRGGRPTAALPPPDTALRVEGEPALYTAQLWLMSSGAYSVSVRVTGGRGEGEVNVPVVSVATRRLGMQRGVGVLLAALGIFLFAGALTIVGAAVREAGLPPGAEPDRNRRKKARAAVAIAALVLGLGLLGGKAWWDSEEGAYLGRLYRTPSLESDLRYSGGARVFRIRFDSTHVRGASPLIPDHGKLVHLFLIRAGGEAGFAHLHPGMRDSLTFESHLPPLPAGRYHVFADIARESGYTETMVDTVELAADTTTSPGPAPNQGPGRQPARRWWLAYDGDDSWHERAPAPGADDSLPGVGVMRWISRRDTLEAGRELKLEFALFGPAGDTLELVPYMGMAGHAVVMKDDGSVYVHLHPMGTIAAASQLAFRMREPGDTIAGALGRRITALCPPPCDRHSVMTIPGRVSFPYEFPAPGRYRVFIQVRRNGGVLTASFRTEVR
jgi:hypothetical protein